MNTLYPELEPFAADVLDVGGGHRVYFEQCGNADGIPVIFLHGGPGSGCNANHRRYFDPEQYRVIIFDQRGCKRSRPVGGVEHNSTQLLLADVETLRARLAIDKLLLFGGSWGATLALLYAQAHPSRVSGMILRGAFLARNCDIEWFTDSDTGLARIFPDHWREYIADFDATERQDLVQALHSRIFSAPRKNAVAAARAWAYWAGRVVTHNLALSAPYALEGDDDAILNEVRIEIHYAYNRYFIDDNHILENVEKLPDVPVTLIHGRRDLTCLPESSWSLHRALPRSELIFVPDAGHLAGDPSMIDALITASDGMAARLAG